MFNKVGCKLDFGLVVFFLVTIVSFIAIKMMEKSVIKYETSETVKTKYSSPEILRKISGEVTVLMPYKLSA